MEKDLHRVREHCQESHKLVQGKLQQTEYRSHQLYSLAYSFCQTNSRAAQLVDSMTYLLGVHKTRFLDLFHSVKAYLHFIGFLISPLKTEIHSKTANVRIFFLQCKEVHCTNSRQQWVKWFATRFLSILRFRTVK